MRRVVSSRLAVGVAGDARLVLSLAVARCDGLRIQDRLTVTGGGRTWAVHPVDVGHHGLLHVAQVPTGEYEVSYEATVTGTETCAPDGAAAQLGALVPSRYAESDRLFGVAREHFGTDAAPDLALRARAWVAGRTAYIAGSSRVTDGATETFLHRAGVCRDFAHLLIALLRASDIPARLVAVYAPGLSPMDFHAVVEAYLDGAWWALDGTGLAPRQSLLRIATGRDAAETSFLSGYGGKVDLHRLEVTAWLDGDLPRDDHDGLVMLGR